MKTSSRWLLLIGCAGLLTALALPQAAYADSVTLTGPATPSVTEGGSAPITFLYTLSNPASGTTLTDLAVGITSSQFAGGDFSDLAGFGFAPAGATPCTFGTGSSLAPGNSCTFGLQVFAPDTGEMDGDFGNERLQIAVGQGPVGVGSTIYATEDLTVTVNDPVVATPEPSSLLLLGTGLLALGWLVRRRVRAA